MRDYARVAPDFWIGETGRELRGDKDAQILAAYLMTCPSANMIGMYYLPITTIAHDTGLSKEGASKALRRLSEAQFACYDAPSEWVFVREMAHFQIGEPLSPGDKRVIGVRNELLRHRKCIFVKDFLERYRDSYHLHDISPFQAPSKPLPSQEQEQAQDIEQEQDIENSKDSKTKRFKPPSLEEVQAYIDANPELRNVSADTFFKYFAVDADPPWHDSRGKPVRNWKQKLRTWSTHAPDRAEHNTGRPAENRRNLDFADSPAEGVTVGDD